MTYIPALEIIGKPRPKKMSPIEAKTKRREYLRKYHKSAKGREALRKADRKNL